ncbi:MAG: amidase [Acidimicrobiia bacterium]
MGDDFAGLDATAQAELVRLGQVSATELLDATIARIERLEPAVAAFTTTRFDRARDEAAGELPDGPFRGVPFARKDLACTLAGEPAYDGVGVLKELDYRAPVTSYLAARFQSIGLVIVGRTSSPELGIMPTTEPLSYGATHNPWDLDRTPGGSSGGSAAAVAAGMVPFAHASDGGGSIRIPAACCGLVGLKTSRGRTSVGPGSDELARPLSVQFAVTRSVRDAAALLDAVAGPEVGDPVTPAPPTARFATQVNTEPAPLRVGLMTTMPGTRDDADPECVAAAVATARVLEAAGHHVERAHPAAFDETERMTAFIPIWSAMAAANLIAIGRKIGRDVTEGDVEPLTWFLAERGREVTGGELLDALSAMGAFTRRFTQWWEDGWDLLLTPTLGELPPALGVLQTPKHPTVGFGRGATFTPFTPVANQTGQPAISLPVALSETGIPVGAQFVAAPGREDLLLQVAGLIEREMDWSHRRAPTHG